MFVSGELDQPMSKDWSNTELPTIENHAKIILDWMASRDLKESFLPKKCKYQ